MRLPGFYGLSPIKVVKRLAHEVSEDDTLGNAAELAYYFLLALFPLLIFLASMLSYLPIPNLFDRIIGSLGRVMPPEGLKLISDNLHDVLSIDRGGLLSFGILAALWAASAGVGAIISQLNIAYDVKEGRPYWKVKLTSIGLTVALALLVLTATALIFFGDRISLWITGHVGLSGVVAILWQIGKWLVALFALFFALQLIYYFGPDVKQEWKWVTPGSFVAVLVWLIGSYGLSYYVGNFGKYNATYGSLGGVIIMMLWFYMSGFIILLGGQLNAVIEHLATGGKAPGERVPGEKITEHKRAA